MVSFLVPITTLLVLRSIDAFSLSREGRVRPTTIVKTAVNVDSRRAFLQTAAGSIAFGMPLISNAAEFTPGGTLVDRSVGIQVGNPDASPSRKVDNSNVLFDKDHYFKFGVAAPWIQPDSVEFPKTMPFVPSQQRYDAIKKYSDRIARGQEYILGLKTNIEAGDFQSIKEPNEPEYMLRPMGLFANSCLASENTGEKNELFLARWYINEIYLRINDIRNASSKEEAMKAYNMLPKAFNSYYSMMNRVITPKIGDKFKYIS